DQGELKRFDIVIANPPFSENYSDIKKHRDRFHFWMPKKKKADFMFVQHMVSVLKDDGRMAVVMPHGVLFRGSEEKNMRQWLVDRGYLEAVIGLPSGLFYGTGIPASVLVINKKGAGARKEVLFINADREYKEGKNQNKLRPEDIAKVSYIYKSKENLKGYAQKIKKSDLEKEDYNFNIRRYVDNSPPAEPQDIKAHLHGGIPTVEVDELQPYWSNYANVRQELFEPLKEGYKQFKPSITAKENFKTILLEHGDILGKRTEYENGVNKWWNSNVAKLEVLPIKQNIFDLYKDFSVSIAQDFSNLGILDLHKSRGAFAAYWDRLETDLKSVSASGWTAELIPEEDILQSQFPEVLEELAKNEARRDELDALFAEVNELEEGEFEEENYEVFPKAELKQLKDTLKIYNGDIRELKKAIKALKIRIKTNDDIDDLTQELAEKEKTQQVTETKKEAIDKKLARHTELTNELKICRSTIAEIKAKKEDLVAKAREKITPDEAKILILARWKETLHSTVMDYVNRYERALITEVEIRFTKYQNTLVSILDSRKEASNQLNNFLMELGYEG
ncbi:N-6 DNA methylase, partial [Bacteroidota bacterium]